MIEWLQMELQVQWVMLTLLVLFMGYHIIKTVWEAFIAMRIADEAMLQSTEGLTTDTGPEPTSLERVRQSRERMMRQIARIERSDGIDISGFASVIEDAFSDLETRLEVEQDSPNTAIELPETIVQQHIANARNAAMAHLDRVTTVDISDLRDELNDQFIQMVDRDLGVPSPTEAATFEARIRRVIQQVELSSNYRTPEMQATVRNMRAAAEGLRQRSAAQQNPRFPRHQANCPYIGTTQRDCACDLNMLVKEIGDDVSKLISTAPEPESPTRLELLMEDD